MRIAITQLRKYHDDKGYPVAIHNSYDAATYVNEMFTSDPGYEIAAVYIMPDLPDATPQEVTPGTHPLFSPADIDRMAFFLGYLAYADRALYAEIGKAWDDRSK